GAGDGERDRRQPERVDGDQAERVVDRRADVAVRRREQRRRPEHSVEPTGLAALQRHAVIMAAGSAGFGAVPADAGTVLGFHLANSGMIKMATMFVILIIGLMAGPAVSL